MNKISILIKSDKGPLIKELEFQVLRESLGNR